LQTFNDLYGWANCTGGWNTLPSGSIVCYVGTALLLQNRTSYCRDLGGYVLEILTQEDYNSLVYYIWKLIMYQKKSNSSYIATGAQLFSNDTGDMLIWTKSKEIVDNSIMRPTGNSTASGQILYLQPINYSSSFNPNFTLKGIIANDMKSEFICIKPGTVSVLIFHIIINLQLLL
jgi:hypothetical protein